MRRVIVVLVGCAVLAACGGEEPLSEQVVGTWVADTGVYEIVRADGTYSAGRTLDDALSAPLDWGTWTIEGTRFIYTTNADAELCTKLVAVGSPDREGVVGTYEIEVSADGDQLLRTLVDDACSARVSDVVPSVTRYIEGE